MLILFLATHLLFRHTHVLDDVLAYAQKNRTLLSEDETSDAT